MRRILSQLMDWLAEEAPHILESFGEPASTDELEAAEAALGFTLPTDVYEAYRVANGQDGSEPPVLFEGVYYWLPLADVVTIYHDLVTMLDTPNFDNQAGDDVIEVQPTWFNRAWLPIFYNGEGDLWCIDLAPTDYGKKGQIIEFWKDDRDARPVVARNLKTLMKQFLYDLEGEQYIIEEDGLLPADLAEEDDQPEEGDDWYDDDEDLYI